MTKQVEEQFIRVFLAVFSTTFELFQKQQKGNFKPILLLEAGLNKAPQGLSAVDVRSPEYELVLTVMLGEGWSKPTSTSPS